jgi:hypothetical protein
MGLKGFDIISVSFVVENLRFILGSELSEDKIKLSLYRPWRPLGLRVVEAPTFSDIRLIDGGRLSTLCAGRFLPPGRFLVLIFVRG